MRSYQVRKYLCGRVVSARSVGPAPELDCNRGLRHTGAAQQHRRERAGLPAVGRWTVRCAPSYARRICDSRIPGARHRIAMQPAAAPARPGYLVVSGGGRPAGPKKQARRAGLCFQWPHQLCRCNRPDAIEQSYSPIFG